MTIIFKQWMDHALPSDQQALAEKMGVTRASLYQISGGNRNVSAAKAQELAAAIKAVKKPHLPEVLQPDLCEACSTCPYAQKVLGKKITTRGWPA